MNKILSTFGAATVTFTHVATVSCGPPPIDNSVLKDFEITYTDGTLNIENVRMQVSSTRDEYFEAMAEIILFEENRDATRLTVRIEEDLNGSDWRPVTIDVDQLGNVNDLSLYDDQKSAYETIGEYMDAGASIENGYNMKGHAFVIKKIIEKIKLIASTTSADATEVIDKLGNLSITSADATEVIDKLGNLSITSTLTRLEAGMVSDIVPDIEALIKMFELDIDVQAIKDIFKDLWKFKKNSKKSTDEGIEILFSHRDTIDIPQEAVLMVSWAK